MEKIQIEEMSGFSEREHYEHHMMLLTQELHQWRFWKALAKLNHDAEEYEYAAAKIAEIEKELN